MNAQKIGFDGSDSYDLNGYLTLLLLTAHNLNGLYQSNIQTIFQSISNKFPNIKYKYQPAPVKLADRCIVKAQTGMYTVHISTHYSVCFNFFEFFNILFRLCRSCMATNRYDML